MDLTKNNSPKIEKLLAIIGALILLPTFVLDWVVAGMITVRGYETSTAVVILFVAIIVAVVNFSRSYDTMSAIVNLISAVGILGIGGYLLLNPQTLLGSNVPYQSKSGLGVRLLLLGGFLILLSVSVFYINHIDRYHPVLTRDTENQ